MPLRFSTAVTMLLASLALQPGCAGPAVRSQSPETDLADIRDVVLVGDLARPFGLDYLKVEDVCMVSGLDGTGADPAPSPQRSAVLAEMHRRSVAHPGRVLASRDTGLVLVRGYLRPGIQKGDRFDVEVRVPSRSEVESLRGGWLLESRLTELEVLEGQIRSGHLLALAKGPVLVDPSSTGEDDSIHQTRGRVLGGGVALQSRSLGLILGAEHQRVRVSQQIGTAINRRFHTYRQGVKQGVSNPKTDEFVELIVHPRYKDNVRRYMQVIRSVPVSETTAEQQARLQLLSRQLLDPVTSASAALRLEAIGSAAVEVLEKGLEADAPEVRFFAAEALAYLDVSSAAAPLGATARQEPAFRVHSLAALSAMDDVGAYDELRSLLDVASDETRYGAFRALWSMNASDGLVRGEELGGRFSYHLVPSEGPALVHVTRSLRPEIAIFGTPPLLAAPFSLEAGKHILVHAAAAGDVRVSRFAVGEPDQKRHVEANLDEVIRAVVELGGTYPDVVQLLQQASEAGVLPARLRVDALPEAGRSFQRHDPPT